MTNYEKHNKRIKDTATLIREDIDRCIRNADTFEAFVNLLKADGYSIRHGTLDKFGEYITFKPYGVSQGIRSYRLGKGYSVSEIKRRISVEYKRPDDFLENEQYNRIVKFSKIPTITYRRYYAKQIWIGRVWKNKKPFVNSFLYKQAVIDNQKMIEEYLLIKRAEIHSLDDVEEYSRKLKADLKTLYNQKQEYPIGSEKRNDLEKKIKEYNFNKRVMARVYEKLRNDRLPVNERELNRTERIHN